MSLAECFFFSAAMKNIGLPLVSTESLVTGDKIFTSGLHTDAV